MAHTPGPWRWGGYTNQPVLISLARHWPYVMSFARLGMQGAQPVFFHRGPGESELAAGDRQLVKDIAIREVPYREDLVALDNDDARLIAKAPELHEALTLMVEAAAVDAETDEGAVTWELALTVAHRVLHDLAKAESR